MAQCRGILGLVALTGISVAIAAGDGRAVMGRKRARNIKVFDVITGKTQVDSGRIKLVFEDMTYIFANDRIRRGVRRSCQALRLSGGLSVLENPNFARRAMSHILPKRIAFQPVHLQGDRHRVGDPPRHNHQRQLEIPMAPANAVRCILYEEPAVGLLLVARRVLVAILNALPDASGCIIFEHDLDMALRVSKDVPIMHKMRVLREGTPAELWADADVPEICLGCNHG